MAYKPSEASDLQNIITRKDYLTNPELHDKYFLQLATLVIRRTLERSINIKELRASKDTSFNDIPLKRWEDIAEYVAHYMNKRRLVELGENNTLSVRVCILKAIAREMIGA